MLNQAKGWHTPKNTPLRIFCQSRALTLKGGFRIWKIGHQNVRVLLNGVGPLPPVT